MKTSVAESLADEEMLLSVDASDDQRQQVATVDSFSLYSCCLIELTDTQTLTQTSLT